MISVEQLTIRFGAFELFNNISFLVNQGDRVGLVGKNGAGKSTLLKVFAGLQQPSEGQVVVPDSVRTGYLPQQMVHRDGKTVYDEAISAFSDVLKLEKEIEEINLQLTERDDYESEDYLKLIERLTEANDHFNLVGGATIHADVEQTLFGLGFTRRDFDQPTNKFSGGWRMRIELAKILLKKPNVFLLDEPTNHLDIESIQWLESFLKDYQGAVVLISHDRAFLDNVTNRTVEISLGKIYDYKASYSKYLELRKERREQQLAAYRNQQKMIGETEQFIERFRYKATKAVQVQSRIKQLDKIDRIEVDDEDLSSINIRFPAAPRAGSIVVETKGLGKAYGSKQVIKDINLIIERGEKVAFVGKNGEGKTTLSKIIVGELDHTGGLKLGHNVKIGYFAQNQDELLDEDKTVLETIDAVAVGDIRTKIRDILGAFLFSGEDVDKKVKVLSGGERSRLAMARLLLEPYNLLVLDEPTNHLDIRSKDILKQALLRYDGTLILVSHDREFLDGLTERIYEFRNQGIKQYNGGIYDFLQKKKLASLKELESRQSADKETENESAGDNKMAYEERKEYDKIIRKAENRVKACEKNIETLEAKVAEMDTVLASPDQQATDSGWFEKYEKLKKDLEKQLHDWESFQLELEELKEKRF
ncbi:MAG TPA: ABC-F family ATP-binding cassette domain-containing protein [Bacteroidales bacterium]|nr:ABC-F family ATP-binding cassette domain-containing protein [Bacteroidales bacterium]